MQYLLTVLIVTNCHRNLTSKDINMVPNHQNLNPSEQYVLIIINYNHYYIMKKDVTLFFLHQLDFFYYIYKIIIEYDNIMFTYKSNLSDCYKTF